MAKGNKSEKKKNILINHIEIRQVNRTSQDIDSWRSAIRSAESTVNPTRRLLYDLYSDILLDGHLTAVIGKRLTAAANAALVFIDANGKKVDGINNLIDTEGFEELLTEVLNAKFWGFTLMDIEFMPETIVPTLIDRRHVKPEKSIITKNPSDLTGIDYTLPPYDRYILTSGKPKDLGLLMKVAQYVIYKRGDFGDWAQFAEIFGMPFRKGTYDGYDEAARLQLVNAMKEAGSAAYAVIPEGTNIEFVANSSTGDGDLYDKLRKACNEEISVCIAGETMTTTQGDKGARSLGEVHKEVANEIQVADKRFLRRVLNSKLVPLLEMHGFNVKGGHFSFPEVEKLDKTKKINIDMRIANRQPVADDYFYEIYGIPKPDNYDQMKEDQKLDREMMQTLKNPIKKEEATNLFNKLKGFFHQAPTT